MKYLLTVALCAGALGWAAPAPTEAGVIERACRQSNRSAASPQLCSCIQRVANSSLSASERRKVARWFGDPHQAQEIRQSSRSSDSKLWERYRAFGDRANQVCG
ncbi:hypothetical protein [Pseudodonghicola xiamenensis]|uniref:Arginine transporter n=1 Tax=Pseudodonghicola xiamenensis TaxID=337702 RepID=A0A8J3HAW7_9RHOB|nr:hypothetical protein [Pseudodonghicola xiamenensis]GHH01756.1 arginine transporter [Pseudodonghicola xiamenensis]